MIKHMGRSLVGCGIMLLCSLCAFAQNDVFEDLRGHWIVDMEKTLELVKTSPKYRPEEEERMPQMIKSIMERMSIEVQDNEILYYRGMSKAESAMVTPFEVDSVDGNTVRLRCADPSGQDVFLTLTLLSPGQMNFKSSQTNDFDYYIWKKAEE